jgi:hypothetical protein
MEGDFESPRRYLTHGTLQSENLFTSSYKNKRARALCNIAAKAKDKANYKKCKTKAIIKTKTNLINFTFFKDALEVMLAGGHQW